jgi:hypothetical protein
VVNLCASHETTSHDGHVISNVTSSKVRDSIRTSLLSADSSEISTNELMFEVNISVTKEHKLEQITISLSAESN